MKSVFDVFLTSKNEVILCQFWKSKVKSKTEVFMTTFDSVLTTILKSFCVSFKKSKMKSKTEVFMTTFDIRSSDCWKKLKKCGGDVKSTGEFVKENDFVFENSSEEENDKSMKTDPFSSRFFLKFNPSRDSVRRLSFLEKDSKVQSFSRFCSQIDLSSDSLQIQRKIDLSSDSTQIQRKIELSQDSLQIQRRINNAFLSRDSLQILRKIELSRDSLRILQKFAIEICLFSVRIFTDKSLEKPRIRQFRGFKLENSRILESQNLRIRI